VVEERALEEERWLTILNFDRNKSKTWLTEEILNEIGGHPDVVKQDKLTTLQIVKRSLSKFSGQRIGPLFGTRTLALSTGLIWFIWLTIGMGYPLFNGKQQNFRIFHLVPVERHTTQSLTSPPQPSSRNISPAAAAAKKTRRTSPTATTPSPRSSACPAASSPATPST
jgi:hypothetical protein